MRRVLIVSPHFCPVNAADMHRVRLALPHLRAHGWEPVVLALAPETIEGAVLEPLLGKTYPADIRIVRTRGLSHRLTRPLGFGGLWLRAGRALRLAGDALLAAEKFDLVFFSTTRFDAFALGPRWLKRHGIPYVLDYQDPWVNDYYARTGTPPPGGRLRYALFHRRALRTEPGVLRRAAGLVSVSPAYIEDLARRYPWFDRRRAEILPFGSSPLDLELAAALRPDHPIIPEHDGFQHLVYAGRAGPDLAPALRLLFRGLADLRRDHPRTAARLRLHFIGTSYAPPALARPTVLPVAAEFALAETVREHPARVPYLEALHYLTRADAVLALGSDDPSYNPSKIVPCLFARRPLLAVLHRLGPALGLARAAGAVALGFDQNTPDQPPLTLFRSWAETGTAPAPVDPAPAAGHSAVEMTRRLAAFFDSALSA
jgi:glycosyltransferase involved in cell wall biosynthesis